MIITLPLEASDPRLGIFAQDGSISKWPDVDAHGEPFEKIWATVMPLGDMTFLVIGPDRGKDIELVKAPVATKVTRGAASKE